jgi:hypothetical protein
MLCFYSYQSAPSQHLLALTPGVPQQDARSFSSMPLCNLAEDTTTGSNSTCTCAITAKAAHGQNPAMKTLHCKAFCS